MMRKLRLKNEKILSQMERDGYAVEHHEGPLGQPMAVFRGEIEIPGRDKHIPCDTAFSINPTDTPGGGRGEFVTLVYEGRDGKNISHQNQVVNNVSYNLPGKLVRDYTDDSQDLLYVTSEPLSKLDKHLAVENVNHHAQIKAKLYPHFEHLDQQLSLKEHSSITDSEQFARNYTTIIRETPPISEARYIPNTDRIRLTE
jgi:hypothetical protein